jgi:hypothetical protein
MDIKGVAWSDTDWTGLVQDRVKSQSHITIDNQSWCQAPIWDPRPIFLSLWDVLLDSCGLLFCSALLTRGRVCNLLLRLGSCNGLLLTCYWAFRFHKYLSYYGDRKWSWHISSIAPAFALPGTSPIWTRILSIKLWHSLGCAKFLRTKMLLNRTLRRCVTKLNFRIRF